MDKSGRDVIHTYIYYQKAKLDALTNILKKINPNTKIIDKG